MTARLALLALLAGAVLAGSTDVAGHRRELESTRVRLRAVRQKIQTLQKQEQGILGQLDLIDQKSGLTRQLIAELTRAQTEREVEIADLGGAIAALEGQMASLTADLERRLLDLYKSRRVVELEVLLSSRSLPEVFRRLVYLRYVADQDEKLFAEYQRLRSELAARKAAREDRLAELVALRRETVGERDSLARSEAEQKQVLGRVRSERTENEAVARELRAAAARLEKLIANLESHRAPRTSVPGSHPLEKKMGNLPWPASGRVVARFGTEENARYRTHTRNNGIDLATSSGTPVKAIAPGTVVYAERFIGYGNMILIDHGDGFYTLYSRVDEIDCRTGQKVIAGQVIARAADQLHFEIRRELQAVDPLLWLR